MTTHLFGIRHHGPGSARSLRTALDKLQPDCILVEGPPDADDMIPLLTHEQMEPPVALLVYSPDNLQMAAYYPFAIFSPEWQAITYALTNNIPVQFMDLPQNLSFAFWEDLQVAAAAAAAEDESNTDEVSDDATPESDDTTGQNGHHGEVNVIPLSGDDAKEGEGQTVEELLAQIEKEREQLLLLTDPLRLLAEAAGYADSERWWEHMVEQRMDSTDLFDAILEAMTALREYAEANVELDPNYAHHEALREAHMRKTIRAAEKKYDRIAVVCGAWHTPALANMPKAKDDNALLKGLSKVKTKATWVPWTYGRLARVSGYGAGIESPGWYHHLWTEPDNVAVGWMTHVARLLREEKLDASPAQIIDAVRLGEGLAALRDRPIPGLPELNEATQTVMCFGSSLPMEIIHDKLVVSERLGAVPDDTPMVPLQQDLQKTQKRLRLKVEPVDRKLKLDLRKPNDLERSYLLHRLNLLGINWGRMERVHGALGTFWENWVIKWRPEFAVDVIEASVWGNTVPDATGAFIKDRADNAEDLRALTDMLEQVRLADLPDATTYVMKRLEDAAAIASDVTLLMNALPPLARIVRYSDVRQTDTRMVARIIDGLVTRIVIGLPGACASLDDDAAGQMFKFVMDTNSAFTLMQHEKHITDWHDALIKMLDSDTLHGLLAGRFTRILLDADRLDIEEGTRRMRLSLSNASDPHQATAWVEGFLVGSGLILLHDDDLWNVIDEWVMSLNEDTFRALLPLLRRTFSTFPAGERYQIGERVRSDHARVNAGDIAFENLDYARADKVLPVVVQLLGIDPAGKAQQNAPQSGGQQQ